MTNELFDIDEFSRRWNTGNLRPNFDKIQKATNDELKAFRRHIKWHRRQPQKHQFSTERTLQGPRKFSVHAPLLQAIEWQLIKRSKLRAWRHRFFLPAHRWWASFWRGADLKDTDHLGPVEVGRNGGRSYLHCVGMRQYLVILRGEIFSYVVRHHWKIITAAIAIAGIYVTYISR